MHTATCDPAGSPAGATAALSPASPDAELVAAVLEGSELALSILVGRYHRALLRLARNFVRDDTTAEDVVQDTWIGVLRGVERFEGRAPFRAWLFRVLTNRARSRAVREARYVPFETTDDLDSLAGHFDRRGAWRLPPREWRITPERLALSAEVRETVVAAMETLPAGQRAVVELRDVQGLDAEDVRTILGLSESNQRVLLHRGRIRLRAALAATLEI